MQTHSKRAEKLIHYTKKAISEFNMIEPGDKVMVCLSGGKDSYTMLWLLNQLKNQHRRQFEIFAFTLDQSQPGWDDTAMRAWLNENEIPHEILQRDTYSIVMDKIPEGKTYCSLCSRLRRGNIYTYAKAHGFTKIALGHHRDDLITTYLMSILYGGQTQSMPPKLLTDDKAHVVIRPMVYCQEKDIAAFALEQAFPIIPCNLCGSQDGLKRVKVKQLIHELAKDNPKVPSNILHAMGSIKPSQLMDKNLWDFDALTIEKQDTLSA